jgi:hypothetical protein
VKSVGMMGAKRCSRCGEKKPLSEFYSRGGPERHLFKSRCKVCLVKINTERYEKNKEKIAEWGRRYRQRPDVAKRRKEYMAEWKKNNSEHARKKRLEWARNNPEKHSASVQRWRRRHPDKYKAGRSEYRKNRYRKDINYRLKKILGTRFANIMKGKKCNETVRNLVGCTMPQLKKHIESQFSDGMSWENYGYPDKDYLSGWHIDHITPCAAFDLSVESERKKCFHYSNLQPLWALDNIKKGAKIEEVGAHPKLSNKVSP